MVEIEKELAGYDDRFEVTGDFLIRISDDVIIEISRVLFAWTLQDLKDIQSMKAMVLVLEGRPPDIARVLEQMGRPDLVRSIQKGSARLAGVILVMHKDLLDDIIERAKEEGLDDMSEVLVGEGRSTSTFDFKNYDVVTVHSE